MSHTENKRLLDNLTKEADLRTELAPAAAGAALSDGDLDTMVGGIKSGANFDGPKPKQPYDSLERLRGAIPS
ncbi:hypothetical protein [Azospirillum sp.]|uniref:hypothetical protein n=1 Tax=Azospirillum sp. TaxID=34012 RepID=UPI002D377A18|nr:hypothetical protein [Azospirillum sp.]HYD64019.1 hypothetical protein [Azospirillum sp.]